MDVVPVQTLACPEGLCGRPLPSMQNVNKVPEAFPVRSPSKVIPAQCYPCIFPLGDLVEEKCFSVTLEEETVKSSSGCALSLAPRPSVFTQTHYYMAKSQVDR